MLSEKHPPSTTYVQLWKTPCVKAQAGQGSITKLSPMVGCNPVLPLVLAREGGMLTLIWNITLSQRDIEG